MNLAVLLKLTGEPIGVLKNQMKRGFCAWPRRPQDLQRPAHPLYVTWRGIIARCYAVNNCNYPGYGGRGIKMCTPWFISFEAFIADLAVLGPRPEGYTLDRINNDGDYEPGNVRWANKQGQARNRRVRSDSGPVPGMVYRPIHRGWRYRYTDLNGRRHSVSAKCPLELLLQIRRINEQK